MDLGCGPGTDLGTLAEAVTATGAVIGVDHDQAAIDAAREHTAELHNIAVHLGDIHALQLAEHIADRARTDFGPGPTRFRGRSVVPRTKWWLGSTRLRGVRVAGRRIGPFHINEPLERREEILVVLVGPMGDRAVRVTPATNARFLHKTVLRRLEHLAVGRRVDRSNWM
ncbi:methyltransferase domain-containing protein [Nocardia sp. 2YAB30]|uniref:methyltransferase domain-containing protein n=1 Tax=unclassified Nocardia TaxID=2637762 RepID=UPI003F94C541